MSGTYDFALQKVASARLLGLIKSGIAAVGVLCALPIGRGADSAGPGQRWNFLVAFAALEACSLALMTSSEGYLPGMVTGQVLQTLAYSSEEMAKAFVADRLPAFSAERTAWMGRYFSCVGLGYFVGPRLARWLKRDGGFSLQGLGAIAVGGISIACTVGTALRVPLMLRCETCCSGGSKKASQKDVGGGGATGRHWTEVLKSPALLSLLGVRVLMMLQFHTVTSNMGLIVKRGLGGDAETMDFVVSYFGGLFAFLQVTWVPALAKLCPKPGIALTLAILLTVVGRASTAAFSSSVTTFLAGYTFYMLGQAWHVPVLIGLISSHAPPEATSTVMGVAKVLEGLATVFGPMVGGNLVHHYGPFAPLWFGSASCAVALIPVLTYAANQLVHEDGKAAAEAQEQKLKAT